jgi:ribonuclease HI
VLQSVREVRAGSYKADDVKHKREVRKLYSLIGAYPGIRHDELDRLYSFASAALRNGELQSDLKRAYAANPDGRTARDLARGLYSDPKSLGKFVESYLRTSAQSSVDHARKPDGTSTWDPEEYKPLVRAAVMKPMEVRVDLYPAYEEKVAAEQISNSTDVRERKCLPFWWDAMYARSAKGIPASAFAHILDRATPREVLHVIRKAEGGKAAGPDGNDIDLWKLITDPRNLGMGEDYTTPCLEVLTKIMNHCFDLAYIPPVLKEGWISLVPKLQKDGSFSGEPEDMRPITVLPEIGKIASRVVTRRLGRVLAANPGYLTGAQRGFQMDGYVTQCTDVLVDVIEDWRERGGDTKLYCVSYDQSKAYDSVQEFTIRASLERFNMPEKFIRYVVSGLRGATSRVRTAGGLTRPFTLQSSVRQGDPLAPIIYALITDALHEGLRENPLFPGLPPDGYTMSAPDPVSGEAVQVCSSGYADDSAIVALSIPGIERPHAWVRDFFGAHCFKMNCKKSVLTCCHPVSPKNPGPVLLSVDGMRTITPHGPDYTFRYLGLFLNLSLVWRVQIGRMWGTVISVCAAIKRNKFTIPMSVFAIGQFLIPRIRIALVTALVPDRVLVLMDDRIRAAVLAADNICLRRSLSVDAFYLYSGIPRLVDHRVAIRGEELMVLLNSDVPASRTTRVRLQSHSSRAYKTAGLLHTHAGADILYRSKDESVDTALVSDVWDPAAGGWSEWRPHRAPTVRSTTRPWSGGVINHYTDGSTGKDSREPSGSSVIVTCGGEVIHEHAFPCRASGNNYLAELVAAVSAVLMSPSDAPVVINTDSTAVIGAINKGRSIDWASGERRSDYAISQRSRALSAARPVVNMFREIIESRDGPVSFRHVKAHTGGTSFAVKMNELADSAANRSRLEWKGRRDAVPYRLYGDFRYTMEITGTSVIGSFRRAILRECAGRISPPAYTAPRDPAPVDRLAPPPNVKHSQRLGAGNPRGLRALAVAVQKARDPGLLRFLLLVSAEWLPVERRLMVSRVDAGRGEGCKLCGGSRESVRHVYACTHPAVVVVRDHAVEECVQILVDAGVVVGLRPVSCLAVEPETQHRIRWTPVWFDLSGRYWLEFRSAEGCPIPPIAPIRDGLADILGVLPVDLDNLFTWVRRSNGWDRRTLTEIEDLMGRVRMCLVRGAHQVYRTRCAWFDRWLRSESGDQAREDLAIVLATKQRSRRQTRVKKSVAKRLAARSRARELQFSDPSVVRRTVTYPRGRVLRHIDHFERGGALVHVRGPSTCVVTGTRDQVASALDDLAHVLGRYPSRQRRQRTFDYPMLSVLPLDVDVQEWRERLAWRGTVAVPWY